MSWIPGFSENFDGKTVFRTPTNPPLLGSGSRFDRLKAIEIYYSKKRLNLRDQGLEIGYEILFK